MFKSYVVIGVLVSQSIHNKKYVKLYYKVIEYKITYFYFMFFKWSPCSEITEER